MLLTVRVCIDRNRTDKTRMIYYYYNNVKSLFNFGGHPYVLSIPLSHILHCLIFISQK